MSQAGVLHASPNSLGQLAWPSFCSDCEDLMGRAGLWIDYLADELLPVLAADGLGKLGHATDLPALHAALEAETDDKTRDRLAWALEKLESDDV